MWINKHLWVEFTRTTAQAHRLQLGGTEVGLELVCRGSILSSDILNNDLFRYQLQGLISEEKYQHNLDIDSWFGFSEPTFNSKEQRETRNLENHT